MTENESELRGRVAKLIKDEELVINLGSASGVERGMVFEVLSRETEDIYDPVTRKSSVLLTGSKLGYVLRTWVIILRLRRSPRQEEMS